MAYTATLLTSSLTPRRSRNMPKHGKPEGIAKDDAVHEALECFKAAQSNESENRASALEDIKFARLGEQWPQAILTQRNQERRPALTVNKLPAFIRQVTNEARQNKPAMKVRPVDSGADRQTADVMTGLIRNIEQTSNADVAYDTGADFAVSGGFGYWKVDFDYSHDDSFDKDIKICPVYDPFSIYGDPHSQSADSSDWMKAFELCPLTVDEFEAEYKDAAQVSWDSETPINEDDEELTVAKYWVREETERTLLKLSDGTVVAEEAFLAKNNGLSMKEIAAATGMQIVGTRKARSWKVKRLVLSGVEKLDEEDWPGIYIPIVPVYGDVVNIEGKRYLHSLIRHAKDAQRQYNFQRSAEVEMIALEPKVPWIGPKGAFDEDPNWETANSANHSYLEYVGQQPPQRTPVDTARGAAAIQAARAANDDMKAIIGIYDASLGQRSNETSGKAIMARQREGDVSTYHFIDNLSRAIRHTGRIVMDLIPKVYTPGRIVRTLGSDGDVEQAQIGSRAVPPNPQAGVAGVYDLAAGKYDLTVEAGPSYTTRRVEAAEAMTAMFQANPDTVPLLADLWAKMQDFPFADKIEERVKGMQQAQQGPSPEQQKMEIEKQKLALQAENDQRKAQLDLAMEQQRMQLERVKAEQEIELEREKAAAQMEIERTKAGMQLELQQQKTQADIHTKTQMAEHGAMLKEKGMEQKQAAQTAINLPEGVGQAMAEAIGAAMAPIGAEIGRAVKDALAGVTLKVNMPKMRRTAVRDPKTRELIGAVDEPFEETTLQ